MIDKFSEAELEYSFLSEKPIDFRKILLKYASKWKLFALTISICVFVGIVYLIYAEKLYNIETSILFRDDSRGGGVSELNIQKEMGLITRRNNADNEVEVLKKSFIVEQAVRKLGLYASYSESLPVLPFSEGSVGKIIPRFITHKNFILYDNEVPFKILLNDAVLESLSQEIRFNVKAQPNGQYIFSGEYNGKNFHAQVSQSDSIVVTPFGPLTFISNHQPLAEDKNIHVRLLPPLSVANNYLSSLKVELTSKTSSVADVLFVTPNMNLGRDFLKTYIETYNEKGIRDQIELADKTSRVIDEHLSQLSGELSNVETQAQDYKQSQGLTNIGAQADLYTAQSATVRQQMSDIESQHAIVSNLYNSVQSISNHDRLIPSNSGISSSTLSAQIDEYNKMIHERNRLARIASSSNQSMVDLNNRIEATYNSVKIGLQNERNNLDIQRQDYSSMLSQNYARIRAIPQQERVYSDIKRQQNVKEALFVYLLQKKEEKYMNMASVMPNSKLIDNIFVSGQAAPNVILVGFIFLFLGFFIPVAIIITKDLMRYQISSKDELEQMSTIPVLGEIPKISHAGYLAIEENNNDSFNEMIRLLRTNLMFIINGPEKKVINMLSSISGEGKTFTTINLAMSLALIDKKVLIMELDIRKPKLSGYFNMKDKNGITLFLSGYVSKNELIRPSGIHPNLFIVPSGAIPPNPNELLMKPQLGELIEELRQQFDYIFIDTAPVGAVSDSFLLNKIADVNLYVVRQGVTPKKYVQEAVLYNKENKLSNMYFILNSVDIHKNAYQYGKFKKYGYGYS